MHEQIMILILSSHHRRMQLTMCKLWMLMLIELNIELMFLYVVLDVSYVLKVWTRLCWK